MAPVSLSELEEHLLWGEPVYLLFGKPFFGIAVQQNGPVVIEKEMRLGQVWGAVRAWNENGDLVGARWEPFGMACGRWKRWSSAGQLSSQATYCYGVEIALQKWDRDGNRVENSSTPFQGEVLDSLALLRAEHAHSVEGEPIPAEFAALPEEWPFSTTFATPDDPPVLLPHAQLGTDAPQVHFAELTWFAGESMDEIRYGSEPFTGIGFDRWPNGNLREEWHLEEGYRSRTFRTWYVTGQIAEDHARGESAHVIRRWYPNGNLAALEVGIREGDWRRKWGEEGELLQEQIDPESHSGFRDRIRKELEQRVAAGELTEQRIPTREEWHL